MPFSVRDLRYHPDEHFGSFYMYLQRHAQHYLGPLAFDAFEVDQVVDHVIEQLTRLNVLGGADTAPENTITRFTDAQFYAFLKQMIRNKAIDRLRKHRLPTSTLAELERAGSAEEEMNPLYDVIKSVWGTVPFSSPEEMAMEAASKEELRNLLKQCIKLLKAAPQQLQAVLHELQEIGADELFQDIQKEVPELAGDVAPSHASQNKDHAHKKLRHCLQKSSTNLAVMVALRLSEYEGSSVGTGEWSVDIKTLAQHDLSEEEVRTGLKHLVTKGLLDWQGEEVVRCSSAQRKHLARFYEEGE